MTTATRSNAQNRSVSMLPAYAFAFILPLITVSFVYIGMNVYCAVATDEISSPRLCMGLYQFQENAFTLPSLQ